MSLQLRASVLIQAPPGRVFELVCAPERLPEWNVSVESARRVAPGEPVCLGSRAIFSGRLLGQPLESETEVTEYEPPRLFATRAIRGPRLFTRFELEMLGDCTRVHVEVQGDMPGGAIGQRLAEGFLRKELTASLQRLRAIGETGR
jgi:uncharacterized protein YndB with AHSA1/START domain